MLFHDVGLSRDEILQEIADALQSPTAVVFLDTSLLLHCYEIGPGARDELLGALANLKQRVRIPLWAARETWDKSSNNEIGRTPLKSTASHLNKHLDRFVTEARRFVEDGSITQPAMTKDEYETRLQTAREELSNLVKLVSDTDRRPEDTSAALIPFMNERLIPSDLTKVLFRVRNEAELRYNHRIPPGFMDGGKPNSEGNLFDGKRADHEDDGVGDPNFSGGKKLNRYGDVIIWFEILEAIRSDNVEHLVLITRDVKKDWVYKPKRLNDEFGRPIANASVTLAHPLLVHEAKSITPALKSVHVLSLDAFVQILNGNLQYPVPKLLSALQAKSDSVARKHGAKAAASRQDAIDEEGPAIFSSADLQYVPVADDPFDKLIIELSVRDFRVQNAAVLRLEELTERGSRIQQIQLGLVLARAVTSGALEPLAYLQDLLAGSQSAASERRHVMMGALAAVYLTEHGELRKPQADPDLTTLLFEWSADPTLRPACEAVLERLRPQRNQYLALPLDAPASIRLEILAERQEGEPPVLSSVLANGQPVIERIAAKNRRIAKLGRESDTIEELLLRVATEFVVPRSLLAVDEPNTSTIILPESSGFVRWGPNTGIDLR
jgi:hypothetical protein